MTCCRRPHFRQVKQWLAVQNKKLADLTKDSGPGTGALKGKAKKQARSHTAFQHPPHSAYAWAQVEAQSEIQPHLCNTGADRE